MGDLVLNNKEEVEDFVAGCTFYGTGGGGDPKLGLQMLLDDLSKLGEISILDSSAIRDDAWVCTPFLMGSIAPKTEETMRKLTSLGLTKRITMADRTLVLSVLELQNYANVEVEAIVPTELGGGATPLAIDVAAALGKKAVNGDWSGRAVPEFKQATTFFANLPTHPTVYVDEWGNVSIVKTTVNYDTAELLGKMISVAGFGLVGAAGLLMRAKQMKEVLIANTLSECLLVGRTIRDATTNGKDPAQMVAETMSGWVLFKGKVSKKEWQDREGYMYGINTVKGEAEFEGHMLKIFYKNENQIAWLDDKPYVTSPDLIAVIGRDSGIPITNTDIKQGDAVSVLGLRGRDAFRSPKGLEILCPKYFGYDISYVPIERVMENRR